ncbi:hypothetical protein AB0H83_51565 [Dactylosporangium sp. NPDC050688]|uniref:hypothetical protein n=1 Tax=Dactylosporangium sp. NPDC050688 TaxID=3157217 RepID=UPI0033FF2B9D
MAKSQQMVVSDILELQAIVLDECAVKRGEGEVSEPGSVDSSIEVQSFREDDDLQYVVKTSHTFQNENNELIVTIDVSFAALYQVKDAERATESHLRRFGETRLMLHVIPFLREFLANMTNRLGIPTFYLPLLSRAVDVETKGAS